MKKIDFSQYAPKEGEVLILKSLPADLKAQGGFQWPESGYVEAPDWNIKPECGGGLHGWLWGQGDASLRCRDEDTRWIVASTHHLGTIDLEGKVKVRHCEVKFCGDRETAVAIISHFAPAGTPVIFGTATAGDRGTATAGDMGTATAGDRGTATAGDMGTATAGDMGTATAGYRGTATAGYMGTATAGLYGIIVIEYYDSGRNLYLKKMAFIDGIEYLPGIEYRISNNAEFEAVNNNS